MFTGPKELLSLLCAQLSPSTQQWPLGILISSPRDLELGRGLTVSPSRPIIRFTRDLSGSSGDLKKKEKKKRKRLILLGWIERNEAEKRYQRETTSPLERFFGAISYRVRSTTSVCASGFKVGWELRKKEKKKAF